MRNRARLTITLPSIMLHQIDQAGQRLGVNNRSHAIEKLISISLQSRISTAVILAGGRSSKQLAPFKKIGGQYLFVIMINQLKKYGFDRIVVCLPKERHGQFVQTFGHGDGLGVNIEYSVEVRSLGTAGAIKMAGELLKNEPFLVLHGDILTNMNLQDFVEFHTDEQMPATIAVKPRVGERKYGQVFMQGNKIVKFLKVGTDQGISIINTGIYLINPIVLNMVAYGRPALLEKDIFPVLAERDKLSAFIFQGLWFDLSNPEQLEEAEKRWVS
ncbi:MAG: sugar phosphate nucleotidyltransferase [Patescibacteria group bacterium]|nr:NTP transferase domain-containing protein [Patescibacteria group bacterium]